ncbi:MAG: peptidoglycan-binding domain-containing protein [Candidatus Pacebacteria bacterium]|nr:peptidoglycan-binding domain-containing protein [Candidatus Paceibacterota bacterium]
MTIRILKNILIFNFCFFILFSAINVSEAQAEERRSFYIEPVYDSLGREKINAVLVEATPKIYFYADEMWWNSLSIPKEEVFSSLRELASEFESKIYPVLTSNFGPEWNPGIDKDSRITILIHSMRDEAGGYFSPKDEYTKLEAPNSNEREMVYLNSKYILTSYSKTFLAHEFVHLITFNQKENYHNITEETWLNEARAEYASTLLGYDDDFTGSNLEKRVQIFSDSPSDPLIYWDDKKEDYGALNLFTQYLVDHYGINILKDSLVSNKVGIESIDYALEKNGFSERFSDIFRDWSIAVLVNNCNYGSKYCYLNKNLRNFYVSTQTNFLSSVGSSTLTIVDLTRNWTGNWYRLVGGKGDLNLEFTTNWTDYFTLPYIIKNKNGNYFINFIEIDKATKKGTIKIEDFGTENLSLYLIPIVNRSDGVNYYSFSMSISVAKEGDDLSLINQLLSRIEELNNQITQIRAQIAEIIAKNNNQQDESYASIRNNLYYGLTNNSEVQILQEFLKSQGSEIYPEGLVTGNFLSLTKSAVIRFQEKYASDILDPFGLKKGTGYVGINTRTKINNLIQLSVGPSSFSSY